MTAIVGLGEEARAGEVIGMFHARKNLQMSEVDQGYIYYKCLRYRVLSSEERAMIREAARSSGGEHYRAVLERATRGGNAEEIALRHFLGVQTLGRAMTRFYRAMAENLKKGF